MQRIKMTAPVLALVLAVAPGLPLGAQQAPAETQSGEIVIGGQGTSVDGDEAMFREDSLGERGGVFLERLMYHRTAPAANLTLDARYTPGGCGWLDLDLVSDGWRVQLKSTLVTRWSDTSFADGFLPSGTAVSSLYPGTTTLDPLFGESYPNQTVLRAEGRLTRRLTGADRVTLRFGAFQQSGVRVPMVGGFSFSDVGTAALYTAGLEDADASSSWMEFGGRFTAGPVAIRVDAGLLTRDDGRTVTMPAYGSATLLDLNRWNPSTSADTAWGGAGISWKHRGHLVRAAFSWVSTSADPRGGDSRVDPSGATMAPGLEITAGSIDRTAVSGALAWTWKAWRQARLTVAADAQHRYGGGALDLDRRNQPWTVAASIHDEVRAGGTARLDATLGTARLRLTARVSSSDEDVREERATFSQDVVRSRDRTDLRLDGRVPLAEGLSLRGWARYRDDEMDVDLVDLWNGYVAGSWEREEASGFLSLRYARGGLSMSLTGAAWSTDLDSGVPFYDPIFDPSLELVPVSSDTTGRRVTGSLLWNAETASAWLEAGWLQTEYDLPVGSFAGFAPANETVSGTVVAAGGDLRPWKGGTVRGRIEWVGESDDRDADLLRGALSLEQRVRPGISVFARWGYWDLSNTYAPDDEYTAHVFAAGAKVEF